MKFEILLHPKIKDFLDKDPKLKQRVKEKLILVSENPFSFLEHYEGADCYKLRIGKYRALIDVDFDRKILFIRVFDKRSRIYKRKFPKI